MIDDAVVGRIFRAESGRSVAAVIGFCGDIDVAEDAVQEAFTIALRKWPVDGLPPNPGDWITTTARKRAIDRLRREVRGRELLGEAAILAAHDDPREVGTVPDDRLRLIFTCCHPALSTEAQVALTLRLRGGLSTTEAARAFLVAEPHEEGRGNRRHPGAGRGAAHRRTRGRSGASTRGTCRQPAPLQLTGTPMTPARVWISGQR